MRARWSSHGYIDRQTRDLDYFTTPARQVQQFVVCAEDRFFPAEFMRRVVAERLGIVPDEIAAGHCAALSRPRDLASLLDGYVHAHVR